jgi:hypothetical protein
MTFKHVKFQDSAVMRSLERVAQEKGLVKEEDLVKTASLSKKANLTPSDNLLENLLKLSAGLRESGFSKYADELEDKAFAYRQAQTLYETSKEKGEDLVDAAHPKGSHKLEDVDGDDLATIETIIDQQLKDLEMIEKKPTGKLASAKDILNAVRVVLAQDATDQITDQINEQLSIVLASVRKLDTLTSKELTFDLSTGYIPNLAMLAKNPKVDNLREMQKIISKMRWRLKPGAMFGVTEDLWTQIEPLQVAAEKAVEKAINLRIKFNQIKSKELSGETTPAVPAPAPVVNPVAEKIKGAKMSLNGIAALVKADTTADPVDVKDVTAWISRIDGALKELETQSANMNPADVDAALAKLTKDFSRVRQEWA